jgi:hypothetical protein
MTRRKEILTLEDVPRLDVAALKAGGEVVVGRVTVTAVPGPEAVGLSWRRPGGLCAVQSISLSHYRPGLGGLRALALCGCGAQVASVYLNPDKTGWACRWCLGLRYRSQRIHYPPHR